MGVLEWGMVEARGLGWRQQRPARAGLAWPRRSCGATDSGCLYQLVLVESWLSRSTLLTSVHHPACPLQIPHYNLCDATEAVKPVMGPYYREPMKSPGPFPTHLVEPLVRSFNDDHFVSDTGDIVFYREWLGPLSFVRDACCRVFWLATCLLLEGSSSQT